MRQVEFGRVLHSQHNRYLPHAIQRLFNVWRQDSVRIDPRIVEESIRSLEFSGFERLRKRALRAAGEPTRQGYKTPHQARVTQIGAAELGACPIVDIVFDRQCRMSLQTGRTKVNIAVPRLQANSLRFNADLWVILSVTGGA